jgi:hypothetical protein
LRTEGGNEDRRGQEGDVFATQTTPRRLYKGAPGARASDLLQTIINSDLNQTYLRRGTALPQTLLMTR